jgi:hypothetical protein
VSVPVTAGGTLRLVVTNAGDGDAYDHADWADAQLSCSTTTTPTPTPTPTAHAHPADRRRRGAVPQRPADLAPPVNGYGPFERDMSNGESAAADGAVLTLAGATFRKGLGVHAASDLRYTVPTGCTRFTSTVGVDDEVGTSGSVTFTVSVDGTQLYDSGRLTGASPNATVSVPVTAGGTLRLVVTNAGDGDAYDHADWADAQLSCSTTTTDPTPTRTPDTHPTPRTPRRPRRRPRGATDRPSPSSRHRRVR